MLLDAFGVHVPPWLSPVATFGTVGYFFHKSKLDLKTVEAALETPKKK